MKALLKNLSIDSRGRSLPEEQILYVSSEDIEEEEEGETKLASF